MAIKRGFAALAELESHQSGGGSVPWLSMKDGETAKIRFLQELDESATGYSADNGLAVWAVEHVHPDSKGQKRALCTADEPGGCWACKQDWKNGWAPKTKLYINLLLERKDGSREVVVWSQGYGPKAVVVPMIIDQARDENINSITAAWWKLRRSGEGKTTTWIMMPQAPSDDVDVREYADKLTDIEEKCVRNIPVDEQEAFYSTIPSATQRDDEEEAPFANAKPVEDGGSQDYAKMNW